MGGEAEGYTIENESWEVNIPASHRGRGPVLAVGGSLEAVGKPWRLKAGKAKSNWRGSPSQ